MKREAFKRFISKSEIENLSDDELVVLKRNIRFGETLNGTFKRSQYYPFPRSLCFTEETKLIQKYAKNREELVEIGVFEGASALQVRRIMSSKGYLYLIDPFIEVPDSKLSARYLMARINLLRSRRGSIRWYRDYSYNVVREWDKSIDYLLIDGDHSQRACQQDWDDWHKFVNIDGVVLFHDARFGLGNGKYWDGWPGPSKVVNKLFRNQGSLHNWEIIDEAGSLVVVRRIS